MSAMTKTSFLGDKPINRIGFGAMQLAFSTRSATREEVSTLPAATAAPGLAFSSDPDGARAVLRRAVELGVDHIDTSQYYGPNVVNELIREALYPYPEDLKLVTKVGARRDDVGGWLPVSQLATASLQAEVHFIRAAMPRTRSIWPSI